MPIPITRGVARGLALLLFVTLLAPFAHVGPPLVESARAAVSGLPEGFRDELLHGGLDHPVAVQFAADGRVFVAEKNGRVVVFDGPGASPREFANLQASVHNFWDRGLLGLALSPQFPADPSVFVLYTYNKDPGSASVPRWVGSSLANDPCPSPPGATSDGCVVLGRLSRLTTSSSGGVTETVLIEDWCNQFPSHSVGHLAFGPEGALYASAGDGAGFGSTDYGQFGGRLPSSTEPITPVNPCGDPPGDRGGAMSVPSAEGGALRSQDIRTRWAGDPVGLSGTIIRIDPATGEGWPGNGGRGDPDPNARRIVAYGLRNPFRFTVHPGNGAVWAGDVGWRTFEEINLLADPNGAPRNFGWPCREGPSPQPSYASLGLDLCSSLSDAAEPFLAYQHDRELVAGDGCNSGGSSISGLAFLTVGSGYPATYAGALFFTDYSRGCIWTMLAGPDGTPVQSSLRRFADLRPLAGESGGSTYLTVAPNGDLVYADYDRGEIRRIHYYGPNVPPTASFSASPTSGQVPLEVAFDASGSSDPNEEPLTYAWDLDGDGEYDDGTGSSISRVYTSAGNVNVGLRVTDGLGLVDTTTRTIAAGSSIPSITWSEPRPGLAWAVGDVIPFSATGSDEGQPMPASAFEWTLLIEHCPSGCHSHEITRWTGVRSGTFVAPDHDYPSQLRLTLRVLDSTGTAATQSLTLHPRTVTTTVVSDPPGVPLTVGSVTSTSSTEVTTIAGSIVSVSAPEFAVLGKTTYRFASWSDGGARVHQVAPGKSLTARYGLYAVDAAEKCSNAATVAPGSAWRPGQLATPADVDWYRFTLSSPGRVQIVLGDVAVPSRLELYRGCSTRLAIADRAGTAAEEIIKHLPAGAYAIRISGSGSATAPPHVFRIRRISSGVAILSARAIVNGSSLRLVGDLYNNSSSWRGPISVTARLYDRAGRLLSTRKGTAVLPYLEPRRRTPFVIAGTVPAGFSRATFAVSGPITAVRTQPLVVVATSTTRDAAGRYRVAGRIRNDSIAVSRATVAVTLYGRRAEVLEGGSASVGSRSLARGASTSFSIVFAAPKLAPPDRVVVRARGR